MIRPEFMWGEFCRNVEQPLNPGHGLARAGEGHPRFEQIGKGHSGLEHPRRRVTCSSTLHVPANGSFPCLRSFANLRGVSRAHRGSSSRLLAHSTIGKWGKGMEAKEWTGKRAMVDSGRNSGSAQVMVSAAKVGEAGKRLRVRRDLRLMVETPALLMKSREICCGTTPCRRPALRSGFECRP